MKKLAPWLPPLAVFAAFWPCLDASFVNWDDPGNIVSNPWLATPAVLRHAFTSTHYGHFQPLSWLSLSLDALIGGGRPAVFHLSAVLLHAAAALALFLLLKTLLRPLPAPDGRKALAAALAACLWAVHPLRVEAVAWATERRELLAVLFLLVSARAYAAGRRRAAFLAFVAAALSKVTAAVFPLVLLAWDHWTDGPLDRASLARRVREKAPYLAVSAVALLLGVRAQAVSGTAVPFSVFGPLERLAQAAFGPGYYLWKTVWPANLSPFVFVDCRDEPGRWLPYAALTAAFLAWAWLTRRSRAQSALHAAMLLFLLPSLGFFKSGPQTAADRFFHMASLPLSVAAAFALARAGGRAGLAAALAVFAFIPLTRAQSLVWQDSVSLWARAYDSVERPTPLVVQNLAVALREAGREEEAVALLTRLIADAPGSPASHAVQADGLYEAGDFAGAERLYARALALNDDLPAVRINHGLSLYKLGRLAEAEAAFARAVAQDPRNSDAWHNLGVITARRGAYDEADAHLARALELSPGRADSLRVRALLRGAK
ncbi:MAG: tetratricopeptide repeat protein [Elusimicrobiota bacterium]|nr:tetratricopeptide repeat protein [Elusimicrobiota bacterium]